MKIHKLYDAISNKKTASKIEKLAVSLAILAFIVDIILILIVMNFPVHPRLENFVGKNLLASITTPLNIILFYEILHLVLALPKSIIVSIQKQFEVISLIVVREAFKVFGQVDVISINSLTEEIATDLVIFLGGGIICFALVSIIKIISVKALRKEEQTSDPTFTKYKKALSFILVLVLTTLAVSEFVLNASSLFGQYAPVFDYISTFFYILIFIDIIVFLSSIYFIDNYGIVFLDSALVVSTIIVRFALSLNAVEQILAILFAIICSLSVISIFAYLWKFDE